MPRKHARKPPSVISAGKDGTSRSNEDDGISSTTGDGGDNVRVNLADATTKGSITAQTLSSTQGNDRTRASETAATHVLDSNAYDFQAMMLTYSSCT